MHRPSCGPRATLAALAALAPLLSAGTASAQATQDVTPPSAAQSLSCLTRPSEPPEFPDRPRHQRSKAFARVKLRFVAADKPPEVELLSSTMREDQLDAMHRHVAKYRLPCLTPTDGAVQAVQEFNYDNSELAPLPMPPERPNSPLLCVVQPPDAMRIDQDRPSRALEHVVITMAFVPTPAGGWAPPEVKVIYTNASDEVIEATTKWAARTRMPCRSDVDGKRAVPVVMSQSFMFKPYGYAPFGFKDARLTLRQFLGMSADLATLRGEFDFNTMNCPFKVNYTIRGPRLPNEVSAGRPVDPNRVPFLRWLAKRDLAFKSDRMANDLFGQTVQIDIPCGTLALGPEEKAASPAASAAAEPSAPPDPV